MKMYNNQNIIPVGTVMNTTLNSLGFQLYNSFSFSFQVFFTGTPTGSCKLQASNDPAFSGQPNANGSGLDVQPVNWTDVKNSTFLVTAAGNVMWDYSDPGFNWVRVVYTDTSGGTSTAVISSSVFNAKGF